jgi:hypothetical protein
LKDVAVIQSWSVRPALSKPTLLLCLLGLVLPNAFSFGALLFDVGAPPRFPAIMAYTTVALIARLAPPLVFVPLYVAVVIADAIWTTAISFNIAPIHFGTALHLSAELDLLRSPSYIVLIAGMCALVFTNIALLIRKRDVLRSGNAPLLVLLSFAFVFVDYFANISPHYQFGELYAADKKMESAAVDSGFREAVVGGRPKRVLLIVVEGLGALDDPAKRAILLRPFNDSELLKRYRVLFGSTTYYGSTTAAELRELCDTRKSYLEIVNDKTTVCLPQVLSMNGYETIALHNFTSTFFDRLNWYPRVGLNKHIFGQDLQGLGMRECGTLFRGPCDVEVVRLIPPYLRDSSKPTFFYWVTLSTHVPVAPRDATPRLACEQGGGPIGHVEVCYMVEMWIDLFEALARMTSEIPPTEILIVGDHAPPLWSKAGRALFVPGKVPWIRLTPRLEQAAAHAP